MLWLIASWNVNGCPFHELFALRLLPHWRAFVPVGVSWNRGTPKWMVYMGKFHTPIYGNLHIMVRPLYSQIGLIIRFPSLKAFIAWKYVTSLSPPWGMFNPSLIDFFFQIWPFPSLKPSSYNFGLTLLQQVQKKLREAANSFSPAEGEAPSDAPQASKGRGRGRGKGRGRGRSNKKESGDNDDDHGANEPREAASSDADLDQEDAELKADLSDPEDKPAATGKAATPKKKPGKKRRAKTPTGKTPSKRRRRTPKLKRALKATHEGDLDSSSQTYSNGETMSQYKPNPSQGCNCFPCCSWEFCKNDDILLCMYAWSKRIQTEITCNWSCSINHNKSFSVVVLCYFQVVHLVHLIFTWPRNRQFLKNTWRPVKC